MAITLGSEPSQNIFVIVSRKRPMTPVTLKNIWLTLAQDIIILMTWHPDDLLTRVKATPCVAFLGPKSHRSLILRDPAARNTPEGFFPTAPPPFSASIIAQSSLSAGSVLMEEDILQNAHSLPSDPDPFGSCRIELTHMNSDSSAITAHASKASFKRRTAPFPIDQSTQWTDHQHRLYLNSLEASFVKELNQSIQSLGWSLRNDSKEAFKSRTLQNSQNMTKQFPVLQDCCWKKICVERNEHMLESTADSHVLAGSLSRLAPAARGFVMRESDVHNHGTLRDEGNWVRGISKFSRWSPRIIDNSCHQESVGCSAEATDQNFKNDVDQGASSSCMPMTKRLKTDTAAASSNDQVVPHGNFHRTDVPSNMNSSSENEGQQELLPELQESFYDPNSDRRSFLRGS